MADTGSDKNNPKYDVELTDGHDTVGLMLINGRGMNDATAIQRNPYPRTSTKIDTGSGKYDSLELPYKSIVQEDWVGGRGSLSYEDDVTRYLDNFRAWTDQDKQICCGPQETYCNDYGASWRSNQQSMPGNVNFTALMGDNKYLARKINIDYSLVDKVAILVKRVGTPANFLYVGLWSDSGGNPAVEITASQVSTSQQTDSISQVCEIDFGNMIWIGGATDCWLVVNENGGTPTDTNHWEVGVNPDTTTGTSNTKRSTNASTWTTVASGLYYRAIDKNKYRFKKFEYKRSIYALDMVGGKLFLNGDRGVASSNVTDKSYLYDLTKTWTVDEWVGCAVLIIRGAGASDKQPWRTIVSNTATALRVDAGASATDWDTTHSTDTEYVILGSDKLKHIHDFTSTITDIAIADDIVYFARENTTVERYNACSIDGVWHDDHYVGEGTASANKLCAIHGPTGWELWGSLDAYEKTGARVWKAKVPPVYSATSDLYDLVQVLDDGKGVWDEQVVSNVTVTKHDYGMKIVAGAGYAGASDVCSKEIAATDITKGTKIGMMIRSSIAQDEGDIKLKLDDTPLLKRNYLPDKVWHYDTEVLPSDVVYRKTFSRPTSVYHYVEDRHDAATPVSYAKCWLPIGNLVDNSNTYGYKLSYVYKDSDEYDYIYVSYPERMSGVYFALGTTKNAETPSTMTAEYWDGIDWTAVTITDGTKPASITLAQSGLVRFTTPDDWNKGCNYDTASYLAQDRYHIRFKFDKSLTANVDIACITAHGDGVTEAPDATQFVSLKNVYDSDYSTFRNDVMFYEKEAIYVRYSKRFNRIEFDFETELNTVASTMNGYYWDGKDFVIMTLSADAFVDGTEAADATLAQDGAVTFTAPPGWQAGCPSYLSEYLSDTDFVIKLAFTMKAFPTTRALGNVRINKITLENTVDPLFAWEEMNNVKDGDTATYDYLNLTTDDYVYVMFSSKFNEVYWDMSVLNAVNTAMVGQYFNGHRWTTLTTGWSDGTAVGGYTLHRTSNALYPMAFTVPHDWQTIEVGQDTGYAVRFYPGADLTEGVKITELYVANNDATALDVPALTADRWNYVEMAIAPNANPNPDDSKIVSIGLNILHAGAQTIYIKYIELITDALPRFIIGNDRINSIEAYGDTVANPWIFSESMVYEIQTQNNNAIVAMPLREISALRSETNGVAHTVADVYLVFNLGSYIQKYYQHSLDDIGPNREEGLPTNRQGDPTTLLSFPGRIFLAIDAKTNGYSTIMLKRSGGWHEIYRAPYGCPIHDMIIQVIPGMSTRLWVSQESDILWMPLPTGTWNPKNDTKYRYTHESVITSGWITAGLMDVLKLWKSVKLYTENLSGTSQYVQVEYQIEDGNLESGWTAIEDTFGISPFEEQLISDDYDIIARRIRLRFKLMTTSNLESPLLKACIVETLVRFPVKYSYALTYRLEDRPEDYSGRKDTAKTAEDQSRILDAWADEPTVLTFRCNYSPFDNKKVVIEPSSLRPIQVDSGNSLFEKHVGTVTLLEV